MKNAAPLIIAAALLWYGLANRNAPAPGPEPQPADVAAAFDNYRVRMAAVWKEGASLQFDSDRAAFEWIKGRSETERKAAFAPVHQLEQDTFGGEKWSDEKRQQVWRKFAEECE